MNINPTGPALPTAPAAPISQAAAARNASGLEQAQSARPSAADRLELSGASHLLEIAKSSEVRMDKVQALRDQIASGTYDLDARADVVADRILDELAE